MRAIRDDRVIAVEFEHQDVAYRVLLPHRKAHFRVEVLEPDEFRAWLCAWRTYARGKHDGQDVVACRVERTGEDWDTVLAPAVPLATPLLAEVTLAIRHALTGPSRPRREGVARA